MDKALDFGSKDCSFEYCRGRFFLLFNKVIIHTPFCAKRDEDEEEPQPLSPLVVKKARKPPKPKVPRLNLESPPTVGASGVTNPPDSDEGLVISQFDVYVANLRLHRKATLLTDRRSAALTNYNNRGQLLPNAYVIVKVLESGPERQATAIVCSCPSNAKRREYLQGLQHQPQSRSTSPLPQDDETDDCVHGRAVRHVLPALVNSVIDNNINVATDGSTIDCLQGNPLVYAVKCVNGTFGVVKKGTSRLWSMTCGESAQCAHLATLKQQAEEHDFEEDLAF
uniref:Uncharacterized protein n=1 Tax=Plectus sambesii TaxID=2011161 RepID=A0A914VNE3_9BILA